MIDFSAPLAGIDAGFAKVDHAAAQISDQGPDPETSVGLIQGQLAVAASVKALKVQDQMAKALLQILP
jgi:hypothetical protein